MHHAEIADIM